MDKKETLIKMLRELSEKELSEVLGDFPRSKRRRGKGKRKGSKRKAQQPESNQFEELYKGLELSKSEKLELDVAAKSDENSKVNLLRGRRGNAEQVKVRCSKCLNDFKVSSSLVHDISRWSCNSCLTGRK